jgi:hypothetical protein
MRLWWTSIRLGHEVSKGDENVAKKRIHEGLKTKRNHEADEGERRAGEVEQVNTATEKSKLRHDSHKSVVCRRNGCILSVIRAEDIQYVL